MSVERSPGALTRAMRLAKMAVYVARGRRPWSRGYHTYRTEFLRRALADSQVVGAFRDGRPLPSGYAQRLDARMVELTWLLSRLPDGPLTMLDAGSSLNHEVVLESERLSDKELTIVTLAPEHECFWHRRVSYVFNDLRQLVFRDASFDAVACISTIEHVGMDNGRYAAVGTDGPHDANSFVTAVQELRRVLKPGGTLYISFPFGRYENHGWFQQFDAQRLDRLIAVFAPDHTIERVYRYSESGWQLSNRDACSECSFFDIHAEAARSGNGIQWPSDMAAGERAVACLELRIPV